MAFTGATAGYQAGANANDSTIAYALESTFGVAATGNYQLTRFTGESFGRQKTRQRPAEITPNYEAEQAVTTQDAASGTLSGAFSSGTYDDLIAGVMMNDQTNVTFATGGATGITLTASVPAASTGAPYQIDFAGVTLGGIKESGVASFFNGATNIGLFGYKRISEATIYVYPLAGQVLAPGALPAGAASFVNWINGTTFKSFTVREMLGGQFFVRTGGFINKASFTFQQGQFANVAFDWMFAGEMATANDPAFSVSPAPTGTVIDTVNGFGGLSVNGVARKGVKAFSLVLTRDGSAQDFAMGSALAEGMQPGSMLASGSAEIFFNSEDEYESFSQEKSVAIGAFVKDGSGKGYGLFLPSATFQNPKINAGTKNSTIVASYDIEGNPSGAGGTVSIGPI